MDAVKLRAQFPVCERLAYLNAGTCGPLPGPAVGVATQVLEEIARSGRSTMYYEQVLALAKQRRAAYAALLNAAADDVALTTSTSEGIVRVLAGLELGPATRSSPPTRSTPACWVRSARCVLSAGSPCARCRSRGSPTRSPPRLA